MIAVGLLLVLRSGEKADFQQTGPEDGCQESMPNALRLQADFRPRRDGFGTIHID